MDAQQVADAFGLGRASSLSGPVARGELGEIRRLETDRGSWAVKQEFEPWDAAADEPDAEHGGAFHLACWQAGVPSPEPIVALGGRFSADVAGEPVRVYTWVDITDPDTCLDPAALGELLARIHAVRHRSDFPVHEWFEAPIGEREWKGLLKASWAAGAPYADRLAEVLPHLVAVESILTPMERVQTCHLDLWADNLRRTTGGDLCVIDFDNCGPADPSRELAMVLFEFGREDEARWRTLDAAYRDAGGPGRVTARTDLALTVAQLHHIGHRHVTMWLAARDDEARARSMAGVEEFLGTPLLLPDVDRLVAAVGG
jgi:aminoglycoside phosphotransferase (APT) family kinase protein